MSESWHPRKTEKDVAVARAGVAKYDRGWKYGAGTHEHDHSEPGKGGEVLKPEQVNNTKRLVDPTVAEINAAQTNFDKVVVEGAVSVDSAIELASDTTLDFSNAVLTLAYDGAMITDAVVVSNVTIIVGEMDGNKATYSTTANQGILISQVGSTDITIEGEPGLIHDFGDCGIWIRGTDGFTIDSIESYNNEQDGIYVGGMNDTPSKDGTLINCECHDNTDRGFNNGLQRDTTFISCEAYSNTTEGFNIEDSNNGNKDIRNVVLIGCVAKNNTSNGFETLMQVVGVNFIGCKAYGNGNNGLRVRGSDTYPALNVKVIGGEYFENDDNGILLIYGQEHTKISGVDAYNNNQAASGSCGIFISTVSQINEVTVRDVNAYDDQATATQKYGISIPFDVTGHDIRFENIRGSGNQNWLINDVAGLIVDKKLFGTYTGDGTTGRLIDLGFRPEWVIIEDGAGNLYEVRDSGYGPFIGTTPAGELSIADSGFTVGDNGADADPNTNAETYSYEVKTTSLHG